MDAVHIPVLPEETMRYLAPRTEGSLLVDATVGEGGHSLAFLNRYPDLRIIGIDADREILEVARQRLSVFGDRVCLYNRWSEDFFADFPQAVPRPDSILIDLGVSGYHYEKGERGFSFRKDEALDMRIDRERGTGAAELLKRLSERDLADLLYRNAEERYSRRIARAIVEARACGAITGSGALAELVAGAVPPAYRHGHRHPATKTFQALRIAVNGELSRLDELLRAALKVLAVGGRLAVISFHSLEDRMVKQCFRECGRNCTCPPEAPVCTCGGRRAVRYLTRKPVVPSTDEITYNPPSRSAKLRVVEKLLDED